MPAYTIQTPNSARCRYAGICTGAHGTTGPQYVSGVMDMLADTHLNSPMSGLETASTGRFYFFDRRCTNTSQTTTMQTTNPNRPKCAVHPSEQLEEDHRTGRLRCYLCDPIGSLDDE
jgi:hypothetical protein